MKINRDSADESHGRQTAQADVGHHLASWNPLHVPAHVQKTNTLTALHGQPESAVYNFASAARLSSQTGKQSVNQSGGTSRRRCCPVASRGQSVSHASVLPPAESWPVNQPCPAQRPYNDCSPAVDHGSRRPAAVIVFQLRSWRSSVLLTT